MRTIEQIYVDGEFVIPVGDERLDLFNPATEEKIGEVRLGNTHDARAAVAAAKRAFPAMAASTKMQRIDMLRSLRDVVAERPDELAQAMTEEYGAPAYFTAFSVQNAASVFDVMAETVRNYDFDRVVGKSTVRMLPRGVLAAITPWNSDFGFIATKLAHAIGSGSSLVIKPAEQSAFQTDLFLRRLHRAGLPAGVFNVINGTGPVVGEALTQDPDVATISFTGSTQAAKMIQRSAIDGMKRLVLELGGKAPTIILPDANLETAIPVALMSGFANSGQACVAGTRIIAPRSRLTEISEKLRMETGKFKVGNPRDPEVRIGPLANAAQWERIQSYIRLGIVEGAALLTGGTGRPAGMEKGWFARPTIFAGVRNDMRIAREEIFGPVLCLIAYDNEDEAIEIANDSNYGLQAYVLGSDLRRAEKIAERLVAGRVVINGAPHDPRAPFGGFKQSGIGREFGAFGLDGMLEPRAILTP
ncbi:aldehyde dehydrogenase family protein [Agrobacterium pusense]|uniref:aldehyde dehydrogenase family protein n=1 Tax=Agrobacterium pusense TaxID=648995 RepID=UPI001C6EA500|nr:aldehyde dehydrogenase family protein [Agrobacterium pusense]MBW9071187.1 aldehyde dehydrogenase family protein [Agrobacterium pusense]MBW9085866.1 aldehyde dehydrogenase family protein [Agrobacterium pusense]MBW9127291.1 aldehyde dehydrogenase family protein [Agrobacterium pusense]MBW9138712.1 aldehyde dehydrogenase family protein [Agrobacterium pusense]